MKQPRFTQITGTSPYLYALDQQGNVWKYHDAKGDRHSFWGRLTSHRAKTHEEQSSFKK